MPDTKQLLRETRDRIAPPPDVLGGLERRRRHQENAKRLAAAAVAIVVAVVGLGGWFLLERDAAPRPADRSEELGIFAPVAGRIVFVNEDEVAVAGYDPGPWAIDPSGPADTTAGPRVADDVVSTLAPLGPQDAIPLDWSGDGTDLLFGRMHGDLIVQEDLYVLHSDGSETLLVRGYSGGATISPNGTRVVFSVLSRECGQSGLCVVDAEGGQPVPLPSPSAEGAYAPTFSPDGTQIAYLVHEDDDLTHVWVANADGSGAREILAAEETRSVGAGGLQWSPAGDRLAFGVRGFDGNGDVSSIYTFAPDGSDFTRVITGGDSPHWSPDGSQIAYTINCTEGQASCADGSIVLTLAIADADGSNVREFGFGTSGPWHPAGAAPANEITPTPSESFARADGEVLDFTGVPRDLVAVNPETGEERVLAEDLDNVFSARWSADGRWVAYETEVPEGGWGLWVVGGSQEPRLVATGGDPDLFATLGLYWMWSPTGAELATISRSTLSTIDFTTGETTDLGEIVADLLSTNASPIWAWSPDGTRLVFAAPGGAPGGSLDTVDVRSGERSLLARLPDEDWDLTEEILWSPDGAHIAVLIRKASNEAGRLYVMDADGSNIRVVADDYDPLGVAWSPDGTRLAFGSGSKADGDVRIRVATMDGSAPAEIGGVPFLGCTYNYKCTLTWSPDGSQIAFWKAESGAVTAFDAAGAGEAGPIDELTYLSWAGGWYSCECT